MIKLLAITDPTSHPEADTTVELYNRLALDPRIDFYHLPLRMVTSDFNWKVKQLTKSLSFGEFLDLDNQANTPVSYRDFDLIFSRADRPLPINYYELLSEVEKSVKFVASPKASINCGGNVFLYENFKKYLPDCILSRDPSEISSFLISHQNQIVAKKNHGYGGKWIYKITVQENECLLESIIEGKKTFNTSASCIEYLLSLDSDPYLFVEYFHNVQLGDKRVIVVDGEAYGAFVRKSANQGWINNLTVGGYPELAQVTAEELLIIKETYEIFKAQNIHILGYDFLVNNSGKWSLSEINCRNVGGFGRLEKLTKEPVYDKLIDWLVNFANNVSSI